MLNVKFSNCPRCGKHPNTEVIDGKWILTCNCGASIIGAHSEEQLKRSWTHMAGRIATELECER